MTTPGFKPVILIVPGAWHVPSHYTHLALHLNRLGHTVDIPTLTSTPDPNPFTTDVSIVRDALLSHIDAGLDVILILHSFGGFIGSEAAYGLQKTSSKSGIIKIIYIAAFMVKEGFKFGGADQIPDSCVLDTEDPTLYHHANPEFAFYNGVPAHLIPKALRDLVPKPKSHPESGPVHAAWREIPTAYVVCEEDQALPVQAQDRMVEMVRGEGVEIEVRRLKCGHSPFLSVPRETARLVMELGKGA